MANILFKRKQPAVFYLEPEAFPGVKRVAAKVAKDFETVCGAETGIVELTGVPKAGEQGNEPAGIPDGQKTTAVIAATVGHSPLLEELERQGNIDLKCGGNGRYLPSDISSGR